MRAASIGTLGIKYKNRITKTGLTSPSSIEIHKSLDNLKRNKISNKPKRKHKIINKTQTKQHEKRQKKQENEQECIDCSIC